MVLLPLLTKRRIVVSREDLVLMLHNDDMDTPPEIAKLSESTQAQCEDMCE